MNIFLKDSITTWEILAVSLSDKKGTGGAERVAQGEALALLAQGRKLPLQSQHSSACWPSQHRADRNRRIPRASWIASLANQ